MDEFLFKTALPLIGTFAVGAVGWVVAHFLGDPILRLSQLRRDVREAIFFTANIGEGTEQKIRDLANTELRRLAARLNALSKDAWYPNRWWWKRRGYDLGLAVSGLTGLSNSLTTALGEKAVCRHDIEKGLGFPFEHTDKEIADIQAAARRGEILTGGRLSANGESCAFIP
jgi:hypothetical protein